MLSLCSFKSYLIELFNPTNSIHFKHGQETKLRSVCVSQDRLTLIAKAVGRSLFWVFYIPEKENS